MVHNSTLFTLKTLCVWRVCAWLVDLSQQAVESESSRSHFTSDSSQVKSFRWNIESSQVKNCDSSPSQWLDVLQHWSIILRLPIWLPPGPIPSLECTPPPSRSKVSYATAEPLQEATKVSLMQYTGWPIKNGMPYFPQYMDAITSISV